MEPKMSFSNLRRLLTFASTRRASLAALLVASVAACDLRGDLDLPDPGLAGPNESGGAEATGSGGAAGDDRGGAPSENGGAAGRGTADVLRGAEYHVDRVLPPQGECGATYTVLATARQQVFACDGYDHGPLYQRARTDAEGLSTAMTCPAECPPVSWVSYHRWGCLDAFNPAIASASVEVSVACSLEPYTPDSLAPPPAADLVGKDGQAGGPPAQEPGLYDEIGGTVEVQCNATEPAVFEYFAPVASCEQPSFASHVAAATNLAQKYHASVPCALGCSSLPFAPNKIESSCEDINGTPTVVVRVHFDVECKGS